jgi:ribosomal protein S17E
MEKAMLKNMIKKTGKSINEWIGIVNEQNFVHNKDIVEFLKEEHSVGHFYAHLIVKNKNK